MFLGSYAHTLDSKGRMATPARCRDELSGGLIVTRDIDACLALYPLPYGGEIAERINARSIVDGDARTFRRMNFADAIDLVPDVQGRILVPLKLRAYAGIERDATVIGVHSFLEAFCPDRRSAVREAFDAGGAPAQRPASLI